MYVNEDQASVLKSNNREGFSLLTYIDKLDKKPETTEDTIYFVGCLFLIMLKRHRELLFEAVSNYMRIWVARRSFNFAGVR
jgi:hypothetical protein